MSLDTSIQILSHQILDVGTIGGGTTLSGVEAREIIEDFLADALVGGQNIDISYTDVPSPGIVRIMTSYSLVVSGTVTVGETAVIAHKDNYNITFGYDNVGNGLTSGATDNIFIGRDAGASTTASDYSVYIGYRAGYETGISYTGTHENVFIGREAGRDAQWQRRSVFIGPYAGAEATDNNSYYNIAIGYQAGFRLRNTGNVVVGYQAMPSQADTDSYQYRNVIIGQQAGYTLTGNDNVCIGYRAGGYMYAHLNDNVAIGAYSMTTDHGVGTSNEQRGSVAIGRRALYIQESTPGSLGYYNVAIGQDAGYCNNQQLMGKDYNVFLGSSAGTGSSGSSNVFIGYQAGTNVSDSNRLYIANTSTATPLIYGEFDTPMLRFNGDIEFGSYTISGTGDIYCNDIWTSGTTVHIGDYIELSDTGSALAINAPVESTGLTVNGDVWYEDTFWDDLRVPGLSVEGGTVSGTDLRSFGPDGAIYTYQFSGVTNNEVFFTVQLPHNYKEGTDIYPHMHYTPTTASGGYSRWRLEYQWTNIEDTVPVTSFVKTTATVSGTAWHHQIHNFGAIDGTGKKISSMLTCRLRRTPGHPSDTYTDWIAFLEFDFHYEIDNPGSRQQYIK